MERSNKQRETDSYRNKFSHWNFGVWTMDKLSNRQAIKIGRELEQAKGVKKK